ncbi:MAG: MFS transporter [Ignavibacteriota bacterium]
MGAYATSIFMLGWATGGVFFGILGDRIGRVRTMVWTILCYTLFTGLSMLATGIWDFNAYRFLCGLGVGGQFAVGVALVAEVVPPRARPYALGTLQSFSSIGQHDRGDGGDSARPAGTLGHDSWSMAMGIPLGGDPGAAGLRRVPQIEGARAVAQSARRKNGNSGRTVSCSPIRDGSVIRSSGWSCRWQEWWGSGASATSATICSSRC